MLRHSTTLTHSPFGLAALALGLQTSPSFAQEVAADEAVEVVPPALLKEAECLYPPEALEQRLNATVELALQLDAQGDVVDAEVLRVLVTPDNAVDPQAELKRDELFAQAASEAAQRSTFSPAVRQGVAVAARFRFQKSCLPPEEVVQDDAPNPGSEPTSPEGDLNGSQQDATDGEVDKPAEIIVRGTSIEETMEGSAEAVEVIDTTQAQRQSSDMGQVVGRAPGVNVRRTGGLGSGIRFSLNGLQDNQIRFFLDGVPLELSGYQFGIANVPVNLVSRVEIYSGVVPVRFGADALGGAVNLVSEGNLRETGTSVSYQVGSFGTHRATALANYANDKTKIFARIDGFLDRAENDYPVDVEVPDDTGRPQSVQAQRFHDAYTAQGLGVELGVVDRPWARRLSVRGFVSGYDKELQHNAAMTIPYGEPTYSQDIVGFTVRHRASASHSKWSVESAWGYSRESSRYLDVGSCVYNWLGECVFVRSILGEVESYPGHNGADQHVTRDSVFARIHPSFRAADGHTIRATLAPTHLNQHGEDWRRRGRGVVDPLTGRRSITSWTTGLEYVMDIENWGLQAIPFVKYYYQLANGESFGPDDVTHYEGSSSQAPGGGLMLRQNITPWLLIKASYEYATRMPAPFEVLGDNAFVDPNLELAPEQSHNLNWGGALDANVKGAGDFQAGAFGFFRATQDLILLTIRNGSGVRQIHQNVYGARASGVELSAGWASPGEYLAVNGNLTSQHMVNSSSEGAFGNYEGSKLPHRPSLFAHGEIRGRLPQLFLSGDALELISQLDWVDEFLRGWEGVGNSEYKLAVPSQLTLGIALSYLVNRGFGATSLTAEVQNVTNAQVFDFYGVQKPGRAFYFKATLDI